MPDQEELLLRCFSSVFPALTQEEIEDATAETIGVWDSLSTVTLAAVIQEEFNMEIDPDALPNLNSYRAFRDYLSTH
jgi:acyl carrier protein